MQDSRFKWVGGAACLDFNNTVSWGSTELAEERLRSPGDLREWGAAAGFDRDLSDLSEAAALRRTLHRVFSPLSRWNAPAPEDLAAFNRYLGRALASARLARGKGTFGWDFRGSNLGPILSGVVWSAAGLLASPELRLLRECGNPECGWLFIDRSRRKNRRWCEMKECGNRAKARRYYERHRRS